MAENPKPTQSTSSSPSTPTPAPAPKPAPKPEEETAEESERQARARARSRPTSSGGGGTAFTQIVTGAISTPVAAEELPNAGMSDAGAAMLERQAQEAAGVDSTPTTYAPPTGVEYVEDTEAAEAAQGQPIVGTWGVLPVDRFRAEKVQPLPPPGETERGWSPEVVARHPEVLAATMAEIAGGAKTDGAPTPEQLDPTDSAGLAAALRETGFLQVRMTDLRNKAIRLATTRLAQIQESYANSGVHAEAAAEQAIKMAEANAQSSASAVPEEVEA